MDEVRAAVDDAKRILGSCGVDVDVTADQLWDWFQTELPIPDIELGDVVLNPLLAVHELVEIDEVLKMGLTITKDVIIRNPEKVDDAHVKAARIEIMVAKAIGAADHLRMRISDIEKWCEDKSLTERRRAEYRELLVQTKECIDHLAHSGK